MSMHERYRRVEGMKKTVLFLLASMAAAVLAACGAAALSAVPVLGQVPNRGSVSDKEFSETRQGKKRKREPGL